MFMKTSFLNVSFNSLETITMPSYIIEVEDTFILVNKLIQQNPKTFFFKINHKQINTLLDLTNCSPYELWYFDEKEKFTGKSFSLQKGGAPFLIQTQARFIALVPLNIKYTAIQNSSIQEGGGNFIISKTFIPVSEPYAIEIAQWTLSLFALTNEELIETINNEIEKKGWVAARGFYNDCLKKEIRNRPFNSEILFEFDTKGIVISFKLNSKVKLINKTLEFITIN